MRATVAELRPHLAAVERMLQGVAPRGSDCRVATTARSPASSPICRGTPGQTRSGAFQAFADKALAPLADGRPGGAESRGQGRVPTTGGADQYDPARRAKAGEVLDRRSQRSSSLWSSPASSGVWRVWRFAIGNSPCGRRYHTPHLLVNNFCKDTKV